MALISSKGLALCMEEPTFCDHLLFIFKDFIHLFMRDTQRGRDTGREREKQAPRREPDVGLIPGLQDHALGQRQALNC